MAGSIFRTGRNEAIFVYFYLEYKVLQSREIWFRFPIFRALPKYFPKIQTRSCPKGWKIQSAEIISSRFSPFSIKEIEKTRKRFVRTGHVQLIYGEHRKLVYVEIVAGPLVHWWIRFKGGPIESEIGDEADWNWRNWLVMPQVSIHKEGSLLKTGVTYTALKRVHHCMQKTTMKLFVTGDCCGHGDARNPPSPPKTKFAFIHHRYRIRPLYTHTQ